MKNGEKSGNSRAPRRVTAAMVAEHAGVSTATVSLVANGKSAGRVSAANEQRVRESIRELGYFVDSIGRSLAKGVSSLVVLVAPDISNPFFAKVIAGVRSVLASDYQLLGMEYRRDDIESEVLYTELQLNTVLFGGVRACR